MSTAEAGHPACLAVPAPEVGTNQTLVGHRPSHPTPCGPGLRPQGPAALDSILQVAKLRESWASSEATRRSMLACRSRDTRPEILLRSAVHRLGLRFRVCIRPVPGVRRTADLVFTRQRLAVFVDGCFWHGCPEHYTAPKTNTRYWAEKVHANRMRDRDTDARLEEQGWTVMRFWEHQNPHEAAHLVRDEVTHFSRRTHRR